MQKVFGFNRTFMELKSDLQISDSTILEVLIVPLWNWNMGYNRIGISYYSSFNRTFMELKFNSDMKKNNAKRF